MKRPERCTACGSLDIVVIVDGDDDYIECTSCGTRFDEMAFLVPRNSGDQQADPDFELYCVECDSDFVVKGDTNRRAWLQTHQGSDACVRKCPCSSCVKGHR